MDTGTDSSADVLDLLSTSQTSPLELIAGEAVGNELKTWVQSQEEQREFFKTLPCENGAPYIFFVSDSGTAHVVQGCCNSWTCQRCGHMRALHEYGRMVNGAKQLAAAGESLFFLTLTCRGKDLSAAAADAGYLEWTNRLLTNLRTRQKRAALPWAYAQVTERQKRQHPHSHLITTYAPDDVEDCAAGCWLPNGVRAKHDTLYSAQLVTDCVRAGLGPMVDLSFINSPVAVAVYAAKYMFKEAVSTEWPVGWRRVRYSHSWPKLPQRSLPLAFPLVRMSDWLRMQQLGYRVHADCDETRAAAERRNIKCVV